MMKVITELECHTKKYFPNAKDWEVLGTANEKQNGQPKSNPVSVSMTGEDM